MNNYYQKEIEKIKEKIGAWNYLVNYIKENVNIDEIKKWFPLPKSQKAKKIEKFKEFLKNISKFEKGIYFQFKRTVYFDYIIVKYYYKTNEFIELTLFGYNKDDNTFIDYSIDFYETEKIENDIKTIETIIKLISKINYSGFKNLLKILI